MNCQYCGEHFEIDDEVVSIKETKEIFHLVECFTNHMFDIYCEESLPYLEYLESLVMKERG